MSHGRVRDGSDGTLFTAIRRELYVREWENASGTVPCMLELSLPYLFFCLIYSAFFLVKTHETHYQTVSGWNRPTESARGTNYL